MTLAEIQAAGIDVNDPANQHVYEFETRITPTSIFAARVNSGGFIPNAYCTRVLCVATAGRIRVYTTVRWVEGANVPILSSLIVPFKASFLKEFFDVQLVVSNLGAPGFTFRNGTAAIGVPAGMSLAPTSAPQSASVAMADIPGGSSAALDGFCVVTTRASLHPAGRLRRDARAVRSVGGAHRRARPADPCVGRVGAPARRRHRRHGATRVSLPLRVGLKNVADVPVYNPEVEMKDGGTGFITQPNQTKRFATSQVDPGDTF